MSRPGVVTTTYGYDAFGQRVFQVGTTTTTLYPFKWYSVASSTGTGAKYATTTEYTFNVDSLVSTTDQQTANGAATGTAQTRYIHPDHLGKHKRRHECQWHRGADLGLLPLWRHEDQH
jgi:hypothetical protein